MAQLRHVGHLPGGPARRALHDLRGRGLKNLRRHHLLGVVGVRALPVEDDAGASSSLIKLHQQGVASLREVHLPRFLLHAVEAPIQHHLHSVELQTAPIVRCEKEGVQPRGLDLQGAPPLDGELVLGQLRTPAAAAGGVVDLRVEEGEVRERARLADEASGGFTQEVDLRGEPRSLGLIRWQRGRQAAFLVDEGHRCTKLRHWRGESIGQQLHPGVRRVKSALQVDELRALQGAGARVALQQYRAGRAREERQLCVHRLRGVGQVDGWVGHRGLGHVPRAVGVAGDVHVIAQAFLQEADVACVVFKAAPARAQRPQCHVRAEGAAHQELPVLHLHLPALVLQGKNVAAPTGAHRARAAGSKAALTIHFHLVEGIHPSAVEFP
mmetsp:Transcript_132271/g.313558  ORF Transcript_132271/g.313558 Transcript_132271/m.313558 type:complete len:382 (+) Transcript_132271:3292-4437(+)